MVILSLGVWGLPALIGLAQVLGWLPRPVAGPAAFAGIVATCTAALLVAPERDPLRSSGSAHQLDAEDG